VILARIVIGQIDIFPGLTEKGNGEKFVRIVTGDGYKRLKEPRAMNRDTRTPISTTHIGKYTVRIYDMAAYAQAVALYHEVGEKKGSVYQASRSFQSSKKTRFHFADAFTHAQRKTS
jgi:hypothetical protein